MSGHSNHLLVFCRRALASLGLLLLWQPCLGQHICAAFDRIGVEDGLPNPSVLRLMQDEKGFMWFGTYAGIVRYDGYEMKIYRPGLGQADTTVHRDLPVLYQDKESRIWLGFMFQPAKLYQYHPSTDQFLPFGFDTLQQRGLLPKGCFVKSMIQDKRGRLLVGTLDGGLFALTLPNSESEQPVAEQFLPDPENPYAIPSHSVSGYMAEDQNGDIWVPTERGLCRFDPDTDRFHLFERAEVGMDAGDRSFCWTTLFDPPSTLWAGTRYRGLLKIDTRDASVVQYAPEPGNPYSIKSASVSGLAKQQGGKLWLLGGAGRGFGKIQQLDIASGHFRPVRNERRSLRVGNVSDLFVDRHQNLWVGVWQGGVFKLRAGYQGFRFLRFPLIKRGAGYAAVSAVTEDQEGRLWLGTYRNGLAAFNRVEGQFETVFAPEDYPEWLAGNPVFSIQETQPGQLVLGSNRGLIRLSHRSRSFQQAASLSFGQGTAIIQAGAQRKYWAINFFKGLYAYDPQQHEARLSTDLENLSTVYPREDGSLLLGGNQFGFYGYWPAQDSLRRYSSSYGAHDIVLDSTGTAWLSTHSSGLLGYDFRSEQLIHLPKPLHRAIGLSRRILKDSCEMLWVGTAEGLVHFDPYRRKVLRKYNAQNWLLPGEPWYYPFSSGAKLKDGTMVFGTASGALLFHPEQLEEDTLPPALALTAFQLFDKAVAPGPGQPIRKEVAYAEKAVLRHDQNDIAISYAALNYKPREQNAYRYRLLPKDKNWVYAGSRTKVFLTALPPGRYTFEVQAVNGDGSWQQQSAQLDLFIRQPWWRTLGARIGYLAMLSLFALGVYRSIRQRYEARRLRELDALKTRLYTNITHEFRTPLTLILGYAAQLQQSGAQAVQQASQMIAHSGQQLLRLVNQMLDLAKIDAGKLELHFIQADVAIFLKYSLASFESAAEQKCIKLSYESEVESLMMDYDPGHLQQITDNLLSNALKFTPEGGEVRLRVERHSQLLQLTVQDTGIGLSPMEAERVFGRFYMADSSLTRKAEGAGIGLAVARDLARLMGGDIQVESQQGQGAAFRLTLPITNKAAVQEAGGLPAKRIATVTQGQEESSASGETVVLLVEDNPHMRQYLRLSLGAAFTIREAADGAEGLAIARAEVPDLIISDIMMPKMDGYEMCRQLRSAQATDHIPIIMLTAKADAASRLQGLELGAEAYLSKPFLPEELAIRVRNALEVRRKLKARYQRLITEAEPPDARLTPDEAFLQRVRDAVLEHLGDVGFGTSQLSHTLGMSRTQLHRKLTQLTGHSTGYFINRVRVEQAKNKLRTTEELVSQIAYSCGFGDPSYFSKVFKQLEGVTPTAFRES